MEENTSINFSYLAVTCCWGESDASESEAARIRQPLLSIEAKDITLVVNYFTVCGTIACFGIIANIINIFIFSKLGYENTMNISLSGLAVSDLFVLLFLLWSNICLSPQFRNSKVSILSSEIQYLTAGWPHCLSARITCIITVFITMERCLCVVVPLKVKTLITKSRTIKVVIFIFVSQILTTTPAYYINYIDWKFFPEQNRSRLGMYRRNNWEQVEGISFFIQITIQGLSFFLVIFFTSLLLIIVKRKTKWRNSSTSEAQNETISLREKKLFRMVVMIAVILIACSTPGMICFFGMAFEPEYTMGGAYDDLFYLTWSFTFIFQTLNSSINIFVYYSMSSKYREQLDKRLARCSRNGFLKKHGHLPDDEIDS